MDGLPGLMKRAVSEPPLVPVAQPPTAMHASSRNATGRREWSTILTLIVRTETRPTAHQVQHQENACQRQQNDVHRAHAASFLLRSDRLADDLTKEHPDELNDC